MCWWAAVGGAVGCGGGACVGVVRAFCGGVSCVVLGGSSWWSVVAVRGGWSWAWQFLGGCGTCGVGMAGGGGGVCVLPACLPFAPFAVSSSAFPLPLSFCFFGLFLCLFFFGGGRVRVARVRLLWCWACVWVCVGAGVGVGAVGAGWRVGSGFPVSVSVLRHLVAFGYRVGSGWSSAVVVWCLCGWFRPLGSAWVAWLDAAVRVGVFVAWAVWTGPNCLVGALLLGAGRLVWARLVSWCAAWVMVWVRFAWV